jgi:hypothetical protein
MKSSEFKTIEKELEALVVEDDEQDEILAK